MKPILVGIVGSVGSGKKQVARLLTNILREQSFNTFCFKCDNSMDKRIFSASDSVDCVVCHGSILFENPNIRNKLDVKIFLDVDGDLRAPSLLDQWNNNLNHEKVLSRCDPIIRQRKYADIWLEEITPEKLKLVADMILSYRHEKEKKTQRREPEEVEVYLDKYQKAPDPPIPDDFM